MIEILEKVLQLLKAGVPNAQHINEEIKEKTSENLLKTAIKLINNAKRSEEDVYKTKSFLIQLITCITMLSDPKYAIDSTTLLISLLDAGLINPYVFIPNYIKYKTTHNIYLQNICLQRLALQNYMEMLIPLESVISAPSASASNTKRSIRKLKFSSSNFQPQNFSSIQTKTLNQSGSFTKIFDPYLNRSIPDILSTKEADIALLYRNLSKCIDELQAQTLPAEPSVTTNYFRGLLYFCFPKYKNVCEILINKLRNKNIITDQSKNELLNILEMVCKSYAEDHFLEKLNVLFWPKENFDFTTSTSCNVIENDCDDYYNEQRNSPVIDNRYYVEYPTTQQNNNISYNNYLFWQPLPAPIQLAPTNQIQFDVDSMLENGADFFQLSFTTFKFNVLPDEEKTNILTRLIERFNESLINVESCLKKTKAYLDQIIILKWFHPKIVHSHEWLILISHLSRYLMEIPKEFYDAVCYYFFKLSRNSSSQFYEKYQKTSFLNIQRLDEFAYILNELLIEHFNYNYFEDLLTELFSCQSKNSIEKRIIKIIVIREIAISHNIINIERPYLVSKIQNLSQTCSSEFMDKINKILMDYDLIDMRSSEELLPLTKKRHY